MDATAIPPALILSRADIAVLMRPADYVDAVEDGFRALAQGRAFSAPPLHLPARDGAFHAKGATMAHGRAYAAIKVNGNFPSNPGRNGLPTIQGVIVLSDAETGALLALMDSTEITLRRTAAATVAAARRLARANASTVAILGCGEQGAAQLAALAAELPSVRRGWAWDRDAAKAAAFAAHWRAELGLDLSAVADHRDATADIIVTCTSARAPFLVDAAPGAFIAAVGADAPAKSEIAPALMARAKVVCDLTAQCVAMGDLHHAIEAGAMAAADVHAELAEIIAGTKPARASEEEIIVFDSTGAAIQDVAAAGLAYERAAARRIGAAHAIGAP